MPTSHFWPVLGQEIGEIPLYVVQERRVTDFEALKLWKGWSGYVSYT